MLLALLVPLLAALGGAAVVAGEVDDSPGLGGLGLLLVLAMVVTSVRRQRAGAHR